MTAILGDPQHGKTTLAKWVVKALCEMPNVSVRVFDSSTKWLFDSPCQFAFTVPQPATTIIKSDQEVIALQQETSVSDNILVQLLAHKSITFDFSEVDAIDFERDSKQVHLPR